MSVLKIKDQNGNWQDIPAIKGADGAIQYRAGTNIQINNNTISTSGLNQTQVQDLIDASIEALGELGFTPTVVEELPSEDIDAHTIYLVPKQDSEQEDAYDEWLYINNAWEHIGSTAVDLSNYYTKSEVNNKTPYILELTETSNYGAPNMYNTVAVRNTTDLQRISDMINELYQKQSSYNYIIIKYPHRANFIGISNVNFMTQKTDYQFQCLSMNPSIVTQNVEVVRSLKLTTTRFVVCGSWSNNIFSASSGMCTWEKEMPINDRYYMHDTFLSKANTSSYNPTSDYHPATKKYVDDSIASAITDALGGSY